MYNKCLAFYFVLAIAYAQRNYIRVDMQRNYFDQVPKGPLSSPGNSLSTCANACDMVGCRVFFMSENGTGSCHRVKSDWFNLIGSGIPKHGAMAVYGDFKRQRSGFKLIQLSCSFFCKCTFFQAQFML